MYVTMNRTKIIAIGKDSAIINYLREIFTHYQFNYGLSTQLKIEYSGQYFHSIDNIISITTADRHFHITKIYLEKFNRNIPINKEEYLIGALLHEIKHAIEWQDDPEKLDLERSMVDNKLYFSNINYHNSIPLEKRAINFANEEKCRWIDIWKRVKR
ncbi:hypothetical protein LCGC14_1315750 [marine sediment metagenome]|uniref:Uncharacterized protein n=1 Tax=marine sediment metagenome TaxID=412755 RepID=A0A0F9KLL2_9ZZZZ